MLINHLQSWDDPPSKCPVPCVQCVQGFRDVWLFLARLTPSMRGFPREIAALQWLWSLSWRIPLTMRPRWVLRWGYRTYISHWNWIVFGLVSAIATPLDVFCEGCKAITWRIIPFSNWLGSPPCISHKFRPFWKGSHNPNPILKGHSKRSSWLLTTSWGPSWG